MSRTPILIALAVLLSPAFSQGADEAAIFADASRMLNQMASDPNTGVPLELLRRSEGVIVVPNMLNASFVVGAKFGRGAFLVRDSKGRWGNPVLIDVAGGSFGLQAGAQATELLMVVRKQDTITRLLAGKGKITLGVDAGVAAGPSGTGLGAETDIEMRAEILSYAKSRGLFAGAAMGGARVWVNRSANGLYYENFAATTFQIIEGDSISVPIDAARLKATLTALIDPPPDEVAEDDAPRDPKVSRSSRMRRGADDDRSAARPSTRRRRPQADEADDEPAPRTARRRPSDAEDEEAAPARPSTRRTRPAEPADEPADDAPATRPKRKAPAATSRPSNPDDAPGA